MYLPFSSFVPYGYQLTTVKTVFTRIEKIVSEEEKQTEYEKATVNLTLNGYPEELIKKVLRNKTKAPELKPQPEKKQFSYKSHTKWMMQPESSKKKC